MSLRPLKDAQTPWQREDLNSPKRDAVEDDEQNDTAGFDRAAEHLFNGKQALGV